MINKNNLKYILLLLIIICSLFIIKANPTYAKFSNDYTTEDDAVGITFDFNLAISDIEEYQSISIDALDAKIFNVKVENNSNNTIYYGVWYRMIEPQDKSNDIVISKLDNSIDNTSDSIEAFKDRLITIIIKNKTKSKIGIDFGVASSDKDANSIEYLSGKRLISGTEKLTYLKEVETGSFVSYTGTNGCIGNTCSGENANYVDSKNMGYCYNSQNKFQKTGWQIAYIKDSSAHLISAGATECLATNKEGNISFNNSKLNDFEPTKKLPKHLSNLNSEAIKYCNEEFTPSGVCDKTTAWAFNATDLNIINNMPTKACYKQKSDSCNGFNDIITGSGSYWLATTYNDEITSYYWNDSNSYLFNSDTSTPYGLRPVIKMDSNVYIIDGKGTKNNPYIISNEIIKKE